MGQGARNIGWGIIAAIWNVFWSIIIPILIFQYLTDADLGEGGPGISITQDEFANFRYWIVSFGMLSTAMVFFKNSAPKKSSRRAVAQLFLIFINCLYFYIYVVSGITTITTNVMIEETQVYFRLNIENLIYVNMGIYALNIIVTLYDLIISIVSPLEVKNEFTEKLHDKEQTIEKYGRFMES